PLTARPGRWRPLRRRESCGQDEGMTTGARARPVALVTGAGRRLGIATATANGPAETGWDVAFAHFDPYDARMPWGPDAGAAQELAGELAGAGARACPVEAN